MSKKQLKTQLRKLRTRDNMEKRRNKKFNQEFQKLTSTNDLSDYLTLNNTFGEYND